MKKIIVFDGPSACGKTTLLGKINLEFLNLGLKVDTMTEKNIMRDLINKLQIKNIIRSGLPPLTESLFWTMNQAYRMETEFSKKEGDIVLIDRYIYTPITFQYLFLKEQGATLEEVSDYISKPFGMPLPSPDISLILTAPMDTLKQRFKKREGRQMSLDEETLTEQASRVYENLGEMFNNYHLLDSNKTVDEIYKEAEQIIRKAGII